MQELVPCDICGVIPTLQKSYSSRMVSHRCKDFNSGWGSKSEVVALWNNSNSQHTVGVGHEKAKEMRTITISDEAANFLTEFTERLSRQNNRGTAFPFYFTVRCVKEVAAPEGCTDEVRYFDNNQAANFTEEEMRENCKEMKVDFDEYVSEHCTKYCVQDIKMNENVFFTLEGYQEHMRLNGHNYRHYKDKYDYIVHAWRNPEIESLLNAVKEIGKSLGSAERPVTEEIGPKKEC